MFCEEQLEAIASVKGTPSDAEWPNFNSHPYFERSKHIFYPKDSPLEGRKGEPKFRFEYEDEEYVFAQLCHYDPQMRPTAYEALTEIDYFSKSDPQPQRNVFEYETTGSDRVVYPHRKIKHTEPVEANANERAHKRAKPGI
jgi:cyclin-dependent kinase 8/11